MRKFARAGIDLQPSDFISAPAEMQFLIKEKIGLGLIRECVPLDPDLATRRIEGLPVRVKTVFVCHPAQQRPVLPLLAYRLAKRCAEIEDVRGRKRPNGRVMEPDLGQLRIFA